MGESFKFSNFSLYMLLGYQSIFVKSDIIKMHKLHIWKIHLKTLKYPIYGGSAAKSNSHQAYDLNILL